MFLNEYESRYTPSKVHGLRVRFRKADSQKSAMDFRIVAQLASTLNLGEKGPVVAPFGGESIVSDQPFAISNQVVVVQLEGRVVEVPISVDSEFQLVPADPSYLEAVRALTNCKIDIAMKGLVRDGREYYELPGTRQRPYFLFRQGAYIASKTRANGVTLVIDPRVQFSSSLTLWEMLKKELETLRVETWTELTPDQAAAVNRTFRSRAFNLRTDYTEINRWGDEESKSYRFLEFDFTKSIAVAMNESSEESPYDWHCKMGRRDRINDRNQPVVRVRAKGGYTPTQIPSLLRVSPDRMALRIYGLSEAAQNFSQKSSGDRVGAMMRYATLLHQAGLIGPVEHPIEVATENVAPIRWTVEGDYLDIRRAKDFQRFFSKGKLLRKPAIDRLIVFHESGARPETEALLQTLMKIAKRFRVPLPPALIIELPRERSTWLQTVIRLAEKEAYDLGDLALFVVEGTGETGKEFDFHDEIKRYSLSERVFPTQFVDTANIRRHVREGRTGKETGLGPELVNTLFKQIVAKCGGVPHGLASGFAPRGTVFVGVDRYRDPFRFDPSASAAVSVFDEHGEHVASTAAFFDQDPSDYIVDLQRLLEVTARRVSTTHAIRKVVLLRDGIPQREAEREYEALEAVAAQYNADFVFLEAPKFTRTRLYGGEADDTGMFVETAPPFTVATDLPGRPTEFVVLSTDPWRGTPKPMLYRIAAMSGTLDLKEEKERLARGIAWLCAHSWVSPTATRLPVPLDYADKMAHLVGRIHTPMQSGIDRPLYL